MPITSVYFLKRDPSWSSAATEEKITAQKTIIRWASGLSSRLLVIPDGFPFRLVSRPALADDSFPTPRLPGYLITLGS